MPGCDAPKTCQGMASASWVWLGPSFPCASFRLVGLGLDVSFGSVEIGIFIGWLHWTGCFILTGNS
ncbi:hypothetical protein BDW42DRAFT_169021 [Aspergillus taichungensis]|uniref:Uncharacterized protein n=1 Tax=Aspergillus taichungensis TaxID=482145 RepID=A0A2J5HVJ9_9EURO|nr:hypothetical protein BDW42DRAFT_169021 [Aspergillus taichungensis]